MYDYEYSEKSAQYVKSKTDIQPEIAIILGSALGGLADEIEDAVVIPYEDIPNFLVSTVAFHAGKLLLGKLQGRPVVCMSGRFHYYEGYSFEELALPIRLFQLLGVKQVVLTNAAGAVNESYRPGDVMIIKDHINLMGASPTRGRNEDQFGGRFFDVSKLYTPDLRALAQSCAERTTLKIHEGVYQFFSGPQYETAAEIRAARVLGADAVGMSTVPEALTAAHCQMPVLGLSLITNMAAGVLDQPLSHDEVKDNARQVEKPFREYVKDVLANMQ